MLPIRPDGKGKDEDDDFYSSMEPNPFFYVPETVGEVKNRIPNDGYEFLKLVKQEREECPDASVPSPKKEIKINNKKHYVPSDQERKVMRSVFFNCKSRIKLGQLKKKYSLKVGEQLPKENDMLGWCAFCLGKEAMLQLEKTVKQCYLKVKDEYNFDPKGYEPYYHFVMSMDNTVHSKVLSYANLWLQHLEFSHRLGLWIYALLLVLEKPLIPSTADVLSFLAGTCVSVRPNLKNDDDVLTIYTIIIAITTYFGCKAKKLVSNVIAKGNSTNNIMVKTSDTSSESGSSSESENMDD